jgi:hypothetical protein
LTRTLEAEVQLPNEAGELRPGMYGRGFIQRELHPNAPVAPIAAMQISSGKRYVFVLRNTKVEQRPITTGVEVDDGKAIEVRAGLAPGDEVVIAGADGLGDGATVRVARDVNPYTGATTTTAKAPAPDGPPRQTN